MAFGVKSPKKHQLSCDVVHGLSPMISSLSKDRLATFHEQADVLDWAVLTIYFHLLSIKYPLTLLFIGARSLFMQCRS
jgi:hypothetical protein